MSTEQGQEGCSPRPRAVGRRQPLGRGRKGPPRGLQGVRSCLHLDPRLPAPGLGVSERLLCRASQAVPACCSSSRTLMPSRRASDLLVVRFSSQ